MAKQTLTQRVNLLQEDLDKTNLSLTGLSLNTVKACEELRDKMPVLAKKICAAHGHKWGLPVLKDARAGDIILAKECLICGIERTRGFYTSLGHERSKLLKMLKKAIKEHSKQR